MAPIDLAILISAKRAPRRCGRYLKTTFWKCFLRVRSLVEAPFLSLVFTAFAQLLAPTKDTRRRVETAKAKVDREFESAVQLVRDKNFIN